MQYNAAIYNTYILLVLGFLMQLERPPAAVREAVLRALRRLAFARTAWHRPGSPHPTCRRWW